MGGLAVVTVDGKWLIVGIIACVPIFAWGVYDVVMLAKEARKERRWLEDKEKQEKASDKANK